MHEHYYFTTKDSVCEVFLFYSKLFNGSEILLNYKSFCFWENYQRGVIESVFSSTETRVFNGESEPGQQRSPI